MRAATAALPEPCSATTSTGTSFCDSSRIMASTVRMPALTLSIQIRALPFCGAPAVARISVLSMSILLRFTQTPFGDIWRPKKNQSGRTRTKGLLSLEHTRCQTSQNVWATPETIYTLFSMSCYQYLLSATYSYVTTLRTNGKFIAHLLRYSAGITSHLPLGTKSQLSEFPILLSLQRDSHRRQQAHSVRLCS